MRSAVAGGVLGLGGLPDVPFAAAPKDATETSRRRRAAKALNILILGGTGFTGPEQVDYALSRGHRVTLFNRNRTRPDMFKGKVDQLIGDLNTDTSALKGKRFDVVIDNPTTMPAWVRNVAQYMKGNTDHYIFISTISVYEKNDTPHADETAPTLPMPADLDPYTTDPQNRGRYYGPLKARSEKEVQQQYPTNFTIIRPGLIVGPLDGSDRFTYWPVRIDRGGEVMAPGTPNDPVQFIDARDIAEWTIRMAEMGPKEAAGIYNATGPRTALTMAEFLFGVKAITSADPHFTWVPADFLEQQKVRPWRDMPTWVPPGPGREGFSLRNIDRALAKGLTFRPLAVTAKETLEWHKTRPQADRDKLTAGAVAGISAQRETEVLAAWHAKEKA
jgi:2'-hydroxyisoflavone reductase